MTKGEKARLLVIRILVVIFMPVLLVIYFVAWLIDWLEWKSGRDVPGYPVHSRKGGKRAD